MSFSRFAVLHRYVLHARLLWRAAPAASVACLALCVGSAAIRTASLVATGKLIGALTVPLRANGAWCWLTVTSVLLLAGPAVAAALSYASRAGAARYLELVCDATIETGTTSFHLSDIEEPATATRLQALRRPPRDWLFVVGIEATWTLLQIRLTGIGALIVVAQWSWWAAIMLLVAWQVYARVFAHWSATLWDELLDVTGNDRRRAAYLRALLTSAAPASEVRLFGLTDWIGDRHRDAWRSAFEAVWRRRGTYARGSLLTLLFPALAIGITLAALGRGATDAGAIVTLVQAVLAMQAFGPHNDPQVGLARTLAGVTGLAAQRTASGLPAVPAARVRFRRAPEPGQSRAAALELRDVTFTYPQAAQPTLQGLSLRIPAGQSVALVGLNGAGKTTLIRLLCGLYVPDTGTVRINGRDPAVDPGARRQIAVIFQDFVRYPLTLRENIAAGMARSTSDSALLEQALRDAGGESLLERLPAGWDTVLSSQYSRGTDLSGGQWQRVAFARALAALRAGAGLLVLDEPTAALDVRAEAALFDRFLAVARGATTLLVSHRLSSVRNAQRIIVLDGGQVAEDGSHEELLAANGLYAGLFRLQAARFSQVGGGR